MAGVRFSGSDAWEPAEGLPSIWDEADPSQVASRAACKRRCIAAAAWVLKRDADEEERRRRAAVLLTIVMRADSGGAQGPRGDLGLSSDSDSSDSDSEAVVKRRRRAAAAAAHHRRAAAAALCLLEAGRWGGARARADNQRLLGSRASPGDGVTRRLCYP